MDTITEQYLAAELHGAILTATPFRREGLYAQWTVLPSGEHALHTFWRIATGPHAGTELEWDIKLQRTELSLSHYHAQGAMNFMLALGLDCHELLGFEDTDFSSDETDVMITPFDDDTVLDAVNAALQREQPLKVIVAVCDERIEILRALR